MLLMLAVSGLAAGVVVTVHARLAAVDVAFQAGCSDAACVRVDRCLKAANGKKNWDQCAKETGLPKDCHCAGKAN